MFLWCLVYKHGLQLPFTETFHKHTTIMGKKPTTMVTGYDQPARLGKLHPAPQVCGEDQLCGVNVGVLHPDVARTKPGTGKDGLPKINTCDQCRRHVYLGEPVMVGDPVNGHHRDEQYCMQCVQLPITRVAGDGRQMLAQVSNYEGAWKGCTQCGSNQAIGNPWVPGERCGWVLTDLCQVHLCYHCAKVEWEKARPDSECPWKPNGGESPAAGV